MNELTINMETTKQHIHKTNNEIDSLLSKNILLSIFVNFYSSGLRMAAWCAQNNLDRFLPLALFAKSYIFVLFP